MNSYTLEQAFDTIGGLSKLGFKMTIFLTARTHLIATLLITFGFFSGASVSLMMSFLELEPAYLCSFPENPNIFLPCAPHDKNDLKGFCGTDLNYKVDWSSPTSLDNWYVQLDLSCKLKSTEIRKLILSVGISKT